MDTIGLQPEDVLGIAITMENDGVAFYTKAAHAAPQAAQRLMLLGLAAMEKEHAAGLVKLRERLVDQTLRDSEVDAVVSEFLGSWLTGQVFDADVAEASQVAARGDVGDVLRMALTMEQAAISFYSGLRSYLASAGAEGLVDKILREEFGHVVALRNAYLQLK
jgi:rubrerythrin